MSTLNASFSLPPHAQFATYHLSSFSAAGIEHASHVWAEAEGAIRFSNCGVWAQHAYCSSCAYGRCHACCNLMCYTGCILRLIGVASLMYRMQLIHVHASLPGEHDPCLCHACHVACMPHMHVFGGVCAHEGRNRVKTLANQRVVGRHPICQPLNTLSDHRLLRKEAWASLVAA